MKFGFIVEANVPPGLTQHRRYKQMIDEAVFAEEAGFDFWGASEQHFMGSIGMSATEVMYAAVAAKTSRIRLRHMIRLLLKFNHPLRIAEQLATLDLISDGRAELGTGRSNSIIALNAFGVDPTETRAQWSESLDVIANALSEDWTEHKGKYWNFPPTHLTPKPLQEPHPPLSVAASSMEMHRIAGEKGIGCMGFDNYLGWGRVEDAAKLYKVAIRAPTAPVGKCVNDTLSFLVLPAYCAKTRERAIKEGGPTVINFLRIVIQAYVNLAKSSPDYAYMAESGTIAGMLDDIDVLLEHTPGVLCGTPEYFVEQITRLESLGYDEVILRVDGDMTHQQIMEALDLIGSYVIPHFKSPRNIVYGSPFGEGTTFLP